MSAEPLIMGLVVTPVFGKQQSAREFLQNELGLTIGEITNHKIPVAAEVLKNEDEALVSCIRDNENVLNVDIAYAQLLEEGTE